MLSDFSFIFGKKAGLIVHSGCDVDSFSSAAAVLFALKGKASCRLVVPDHLNSQAKVFAENLSLGYFLNPDLEIFDILVCFDFSSKHMLGSLLDKFESFSGEKYVVDHHNHRKRYEDAELIVPKKNSVISPSSVSCTEVVFKLLSSTKGIVVPKKAYVCIAAGIVTDSAGFAIAGKDTFSIMSVALAKSGYSYTKLCSLFYFPKDFSERVALFKAAKRARFFRSGDKVIAVSEVGAFEADAASSLIKLGADIAFCGYSDKGKVRISARASSFFCKSNNFDLVEVFRQLKNVFEGDFGGHQGAAAFNSFGSDPWPLLLKCALISHDLIKGKFPGSVYKEIR